MEGLSGLSEAVDGLGPVADAVHAPAMPAVSLPMRGASDAAGVRAACARTEPALHKALDVTGAVPCVCEGGAGSDTAPKSGGFSFSALLPGLSEPSPGSVFLAPSQQPCAGAGRSLPEVLPAVRAAAQLRAVGQADFVIAAFMRSINVQDPAVAGLLIEMGSKLDAVMSELHSISLGQPPVDVHIRGRLLAAMSSTTVRAGGGQLNAVPQLQQQPPAPTVNPTPPQPLGTPLLPASPAVHVPSVASSALTIAPGERQSLHFPYPHSPLGSTVSLSSVVNPRWCEMGLLVSSTCKVLSSGEVEVVVFNPTSTVLPLYHPPSPTSELSDTATWVPLSKAAAPAPASNLRRQDMSGEAALQLEAFEKVLRKHADIGPAIQTFAMATAEHDHDPLEAANLVDVLSSEDGSLNIGKVVECATTLVDNETSPAQALETARSMICQARSGAACATVAVSKQSRGSSDSCSSSQQAGGNAAQSPGLVPSGAPRVQSFSSV